MKKLLAFTLSVTMLMGLTACGGDKEKEPENSAGVLEETTIPEESNAVESAAAESTATAAPTPTPTKEPSYQLQYTYGFSGGYALIRFYDEANRVYCSGMIDESGKLQYYVADSGADSDNSKNGYLFFNKNGTAHMVTPKGKVAAYQLGNDLRMVVTGDGYVVIQEYKSGFDAVEYVYHIYDETGKEAATYSSGERTANSVRYVGEKTFLFIRRDRDDGLNAYGYDSYYADIYFGENNTWLKDQVVTNTGYAFRDYGYCDGIFMFRGATQSGSNNTCTHPGEFTYTDNKGNVKSFNVPAEVGDRPYFLGYSDGVMVFWGSNANGKRVLYCYDMAANKWSGYQGQYVEKMTSGDPIVGSGHVAIALRGADNNTYTMVLDKNGEEVWETPLLGTPNSIRDKKVLLIQNGSNMTCYDLKGKELGQLEHINVSGSLNSGKIIMDSQGKYFTLEGKPAFEIDYTSGKEVKLPTE